MSASKVKARDLRRGTVVLWRGYYWARKPREVAVAKVERLGDLVGPLQERIAKARRITLDDSEAGKRVVDMESGREFEWRGQRP